MSLFEPGRPKTGGRKAGTRNKASLNFKDRLEANGIVLEVEIAKAIAAQNTEMVKVLTSLLPFVTPKLKELDKKEDQPPEKPTINAPQDLEALLDEETSNGPTQ